MAAATLGLGFEWHDCDGVFCRWPPSTVVLEEQKQLGQGSFCAA